MYINHLQCCVCIPKSHNEECEYYILFTMLKKDPSRFHTYIYFLCIFWGWSTLWVGGLVNTCHFQSSKMVSKVFWNCILLPIKYTTFNLQLQTRTKSNCIVHRWKNMIQKFWSTVATCDWLQFFLLMILSNICDQENLQFQIRAMSYSFCYLWSLPNFWEFFVSWGTKHHTNVVWHLHLLILLW